MNRREGSARGADHTKRGDMVLASCGRPGDPFAPIFEAVTRSYDLAPAVPLSLCARRSCGREEKQAAMATLMWLPDRITIFLGRSRSTGKMFLPSDSLTARGLVRSSEGPGHSHSWLAGPVIAVAAGPSMSRSAFDPPHGRCGKYRKLLGSHPQPFSKGPFTP